MSIKYYPLTFRDDYNGRPYISIMSDNTKFLVLHPFYCFGSNNYGRFYTYRSLNNDFDLDDQIEIWIKDTGATCIEKYWNRFKQLLTSMELMLEPSKINVELGDTNMIIKRIPNLDFRPDLLAENTNISDFINGQTQLAPATKSDIISGYVRLGTATFVVMNIECTFEDSDSDLFSYKYYQGEEEELLIENHYEQYSGGYDTPIKNHRDTTTKYAGTIYGLPDSGIILCL